MSRWRGTPECGNESKPLLSPLPPNISRTCSSHHDEACGSIYPKETTLIPPLTGVSMVAIWVTTVLHRGAPPPFSGGSRNASF
jgi:hypothetical protein